MSFIPVTIQSAMRPYMQENYPDEVYSDPDTNMFYFYTNSDDFHCLWTQNKFVRLESAFH